MINYYISYAHKRGFGGITISTELPIREEDILIIREKIHEINPMFEVEEIIIISIYRLER